jgi:hypothetical protein
MAGARSRSNNREKSSERSQSLNRVKGVHRLSSDVGQGLRARWKWKCGGRHAAPLRSGSMGISHAFPECSNGSCFARIRRATPPSRQSVSRFSRPDAERGNHRRVHYRPLHTRGHAARFLLFETAPLEKVPVSEFPTIQATLTQSGCVTWGAVRTISSRAIISSPAGWKEHQTEAATPLNIVSWFVPACANPVCANPNINSGTNANSTSLTNQATRRVCVQG